jgi:hypothetical protein
MEDNNTNNLTNNENNNLIGGKKGGFNPYEIRLRARLGAKRRGYSDDTINDIYPSLGGYNKDTYIGHLKLKNGGMKIVEGEEDNKIIEERNTILKHLVETINKTLPLIQAKKSLKELEYFLNSYSDNKTNENLDTEQKRGILNFFTNI